MAMPPAVSSLLSFPSSSQSVLFAREPPTESENEPRADTSLSAPPLKKTVRVGFLSSARGEGGKLDKIPSVQGKLRYLLRSDDLPKRGIGCFDCHSRSLHLDLGNNGRGCERKIHLTRLVNLQAQVFCIDALKAHEFDMQCVKSYGKQGD
jgi:hypothetical protein